LYQQTKTDMSKDIKNHNLIFKNFEEAQKNCIALQPYLDRLFDLVQYNKDTMSLWTYGLTEEEKKQILDFSKSALKISKEYKNLLTLSLV